jgi:hypothetical protein
VVPILNIKKIMKKNLKHRTVGLIILKRGKQYNIYGEAGSAPIQDLNCGSFRIFVIGETG